MWVNINAFMANLFATGVWGVSPGLSLMVLRCAFEAKSEDTWERHCDTMAAAQWILWNGQALFKLIIYDHNENTATDSSEWLLGKGLEGSSIKPRSVERWRYWKTGFENIEKESDASNECKNLSSRAASLMSSIDQAMLF